MSPFRHDRPDNPLYPFEDDAVRYLTYLTNGVPRLALESMNQAIEEGISGNYALITLEFLKQYHEEITGKVFIKEKLEEYLEYAK